MARKLFLLVVLISLVALAQAPPGYTETFNLSSTNDTWTETFPLHGSSFTPGEVGSLFWGRYAWGDGGFWQFGEVTYDEVQEIYKSKSQLKTTTPASETAIYGTWGRKFVYTYDTSEIPGEVSFKVNIPDGPSITSYDAWFTITAIYSDNNNGTWKFQNEIPALSDYIPTIVGGGNNIDGTPFTISAILWEDTGDHTHSGHFIDFQLTYDASAVPIPGAVWLFGTGLFGLFCLKRRFSCHA